MPCTYCEDVEKNYQRGQFSLPGEYVGHKNKKYQCPVCLQRWFCYNDFHRLWGKVNDDLTWKLLVNDVDVPISIGRECIVVSGYEKHAIDPAHEICNEKVFWPAVRLEPSNGKIKETEIFQWFGEYREGNIFNYQFAFPLLAPLQKYRENLSSFRVPFVGKIKNWPNRDQQSSMAETLNDPKMEKHIAYLMSPDYSHNYGDRGLGAVSFVAGVVLLGDPNVGLIEPRYFFDPSIIEMVNDEFKKKHT